MDNLSREIQLSNCQPTPFSSAVPFRRLGAQLEDANRLPSGLLQQSSCLESEGPQVGRTGRRLHDQSTLWESDCVDVGRNGRSPSAHREGDWRLSGRGVGFMPYVHAAHHAGIQSGTSSSGAALWNIAKSPISRLRVRFDDNGSGGRVVAGFTTCGVGEGDDGLKGDALRLPVKGNLVHRTER